MSKLFKFAVYVVLLNELELFLNLSIISDEKYRYHKIERFIIQEITVHSHKIKKRHSQIELS
jgi:hypothetical protein